MDATNWTPQQQEFISYLANQKTLDGVKVTREAFAKKIKVDPATLWRWQALPGFKTAVFESSLALHVDKIPSLNVAMMGKAMGQKEFAKADTQAYMAMMRQFELLKADKIDHTTMGKELPTPIYGGISAADTAKDI